LLQTSYWKLEFNKINELEKELPVFQGARGYIWMLSWTFQSSRHKWGLSKRRFPGWTTQCRSQGSNSEEEEEKPFIFNLKKFFSFLSWFRRQYNGTFNLQTYFFFFFFVLSAIQNHDSSEISLLEKRFTTNRIYWRKNVYVFFRSNHLEWHISNEIEAIFAKRTACCEN
jgi:hypothetical protein